MLLDVFAKAADQPLWSALRANLFGRVVAKVAAGVVDQALDEVDLTGRVHGVVAVLCQCGKHPGHDRIGPVKQDGGNRGGSESPLPTQVLVVPAREQHASALRADGKRLSPRPVCRVRTVVPNHQRRLDAPLSRLRHAALANHQVSQVLRKSVQVADLESLARQALVRGDQIVKRLALGKRAVQFSRAVAGAVTLGHHQVAVGTHQGGTASPLPGKGVDPLHPDLDGPVPSQRFLLQLAPGLGAGVTGCSGTPLPTTVRVHVVKLHQQVSRVSRDDAQVHRVLAQVKEAQRMVVAVDGQDVGTLRLQVADELERAPKLEATVSKAIGQFQRPAALRIGQVADAKSARTGHSRGRVPVGTANVVLANAAGLFVVAGMQHVSAAQLVNHRPGKAAPRKTSQQGVVVGLGFFQTLGQRSARHAVADPNALKGQRRQRGQGPSVELDEVLVQHKLAVERKHFGQHVDQQASSDIQVSQQAGVLSQARPLDRRRVPFQQGWRQLQRGTQRRHFKHVVLGQPAPGHLEKLVVGFSRNSL